MSTLQRTVMVAGGAGYIGSHVVLALIRAQHRVVVVDNLSTGHRGSVTAAWNLARASAGSGTERRKLTEPEFEKGDVRDASFLDRVFLKHTPDVVMHFCADASVAESVRQPLKYYDNNVGGAISLLSAMQRAGCNRLIFSSTCATFGTPTTVPITEDMPQKPINPYGETKLVIENLLRSQASAAIFPIASISLRYFNACGADASGKLGEAHDPEAHLIPIVLDVALGKREAISVFGSDYATSDGTCVRDYIHVTDLADAHLLAMQYLLQHGKTDFFNLGSGDGYSVNQVIDAVRKVTGHAIPVKQAARRPGDPPALVGGTNKARLLLGWEPQHSSLHEIVASAWKWHQKKQFQT